MCFLSKHLQTVRRDDLRTYTREETHMESDGPDWKTMFFNPLVFSFHGSNLPGRTLF